MKKYLLLFGAVGLITMVSCTPAKKESKPAQVQQQTQEPQVVQPDTSVIISAVPETVPAPAVSNEPAVVNTAVTAPKLNPPHGEPYHRCEIPVGSPLNAAPARPAAPVIRTGAAPTLENEARLNNAQANNPPASTAPTVTNAGATPPKLNPPHGQPFHKCEIPVGSPLN